MKYISPFHLLPPHQLESFNLDNAALYTDYLKVLIDQNSKSGMDVNGYKLSYLDIERMVQMVEDDLPLHIAIFKNKPLLEFLESGNLDFFDNQNSMQDVKKDYHLIKDQNKWIATKANEVTLELVKACDDNTVERLKKIYSYVKNTDPENVENAYRDVHFYIESYLVDLRKRFDQPFRDISKREFFPILSKVVSHNFANMFAYLPPSMNASAAAYSKWCNKAIVTAAMDIDSNVGYYPVKSQLILKRAAEIASIHENRNANVRLVTEIDNYLNGKAIPEPLDKRSPLWKSIGLVSVLLVGGVLLGRKFLSTDVVTDATEQAVETNPNTNANLIAMHTGWNKDAVNAEITKVEHSNFYSIFEYDVDILPNDMALIAQFLPDDMITKYDGFEREFVLKFRLRDLPDVIASHRVKVEYSQGKMQASQYLGPVISTDDKYTLTIKKPKSNAYPMNGRILHLSNGERKLTPFTLNYDRESKTYTIESSGNAPIIITPSTMDSQVYNDGEIDSKQRWIRVINILQAPDNKYLKERNYYKLPAIQIYHNTTNSVAIDGKVEAYGDKGYLRFFSCSREDNLTYTELKGDAYHVTYYTDYKDGSILGMHLVTSDNLGRVFEHLTLYSNKK